MIHSILPMLPILRSTKVACLAVLMVAMTGCSSQTKYPWAKPRNYEEYATDRDLCLKKHTFAVVGEASRHCLHCELFALCMKTRFWQTGPNGPPESSVPCCPGTTAKTPP